MKGFKGKTIRYNLEGRQSMLNVLFLESGIIRAKVCMCAYMLSRNKGVSLKFKTRESEICAKCFSLYVEEYYVCVFIDTYTEMFLYIKR